MRYPTYTTLVEVHVTVTNGPPPDSAQVAEFLSLKGPRWEHPTDDVTWHVTGYEFVPADPDDPNSMPLPCEEVPG